MSTTIQFDNVSFSYYQQKPLIRSLSMTLEGNQAIVLLGANGTGKSTFLKLCLGFLSPDEGQIFLMEESIRQKSPAWIGTQIAYAPQSPDYPYQLSVRDYVLLGRTPFLSRYESPKPGDLAIVNHLLDEINIGHLADISLQDISGGEKQLVSLCRVLVQNTPILILDEIVSELDIKNTMKVLKIVSSIKEKCTVLFSTHDPVIAAAFADTVILFLPDHQIEIGDPKSLLTAQKLSALYQIPTSLIQESPLQILWHKNGKV